MEKSKGEVVASSPINRRRTRRDFMKKALLGASPGLWACGPPVLQRGRTRRRVLVYPKSFWNRLIMMGSIYWTER